MKVLTIHSAAGVSIVTQPFLVGEELEALSLASSKDFVAAVLKEHGALHNPVSLEILNGGHYYFVKDAYDAVAGTPCRLSTVRAKRSFDEETKSWKVNVWDHGGDAATGGDLLVGDTVATCTTLLGVLKTIVDDMEAAGQIHNIFIFTIAGSSIAPKVLQPLDERLTAAGKTLYLVFANAQFHLADNGTDLGFEGAVYNDDAKVQIDKALGDYAGKMRCAVWDWGDRFRKQQEHLHEIWEYYSTHDAPEWLLSGIRARMAHDHK